MRSTSTATALAVLFSSVALGVVAAGPASAATVLVAAPGGIVADAALQRVFVGDASAGKIQAADYTGALVDSVSGLGRVSDLAVSDDGATLYAAVQDLHEIVALNAATLDVKTRYTVPTNTGPRYVAFAGGKVWFTYGDQWDGDLGSVDPAVDPTGESDPVAMAQFPTEGTSPGLWGPALLDTDPNQPGVLAVGQTGISSDSMAVVDVSGAAPQLTAWSGLDYALNNGTRDFDLVPGARQVLVNGTDRDAYANGKFTPAGSYPAGRRADIAPNGLVAQVNGADLAVYRPGAAAPLRTYTTGPAGTQDTLDLTWAPDSSRIFAITGPENDYALQVFTAPTVNTPTLTVDAPAKATRTKPLTVTGKLTADELPSGTELQVVRTDLDSPNGHVLPSVTVDADGTYSFTNSPPAGGTVTYKVSYAGDAEHTPAVASAKVEVSRTTPALTLNNNKKTYEYGKDVSFTAHLGATYKNRTVEIWVDPYGTDRPKKLLKTGKVNSAGNLSATVDMTRDMVVTAAFKGDARYSPRTVKSVAYGKARVSTAVSKHYKTGRIGSLSYYWFHKNTDPVLTTTMNYYPGRKQRFELQVLYQGTWYATYSEYFAVAANGKSAVRLGAPGESGIKARVRSVYADGASGDNVNSTAAGAWKYLYFSN
ncbi:Ig-like domain repeat protein [Streptomyces sp. SID12501]|uniref:Ig-like domain repeat protein n=1 Tax=Streptomyces sp. SID12501 TaxID=2706042 RepID=A0A6B3BDY1_9ACTN|nr:Ig-like domain repeat protein [Streptomyces sp. SID12501]NEC84647.1 Ig-like domain repeat protein [Streptomyces sp. SID12501]